MNEPNKANELVLSQLSCNSGQEDLYQFIKFGIQLGYVLPFGLLYVSFMVSILKRRKHRELFEDSFFTLYLVDGVVTVLFLLFDFSFFRVTSYIRPVCEFFVPFLSTPAFYLTPYYTVYLYSQFAKMLSTLTMSINRYTSINNPILHKTVWAKHCSRAIVAVLLIPLLFVWPVAISQTTFAPYRGQSLIIYDHKFSWARTTVITTAKLSKLGKHMKKVEVSMSIATIFVSAGFVLQLTLQISYLTIDEQVLVTSPWIAMLILELAQVVNDFYMLSGPVILLIIDKRIRSSVFRCSRRQSQHKQVTEMFVRPGTDTL